MLSSKTRIKRRYFKRQIYIGVGCILFVFASFIFASCDNIPFEMISESEEDAIKAVLDDRSFRQFEPDVDASPRKGVILDFFNGVSLWAQYAEGNYALNEWEIRANDYRIERAADGSEIKIYFIKPRSSRTLPNKCENCIETAGISISIRNVFDSKRIAFKLNDPDDSLPSPFPVFRSWTKFREDEYFD
ncbi:hypothetical protein C6502_07105 [Candidatus Poribacteria bacterium]|nr:MAG: hypothetical protein C6502_07105 [Candidatus Poribacteria bacterium]